MHDSDMASGRRGELLYEDPYLGLWADAERAIVLMARTEIPLPANEQELRTFYDGVVEAMASLDRPHFGLLVDGSAAVGRNDAVFERVQAEYRLALFGGFRRVAVILKTLAGRLQIARYGMDKDAVEVAMFGSFTEAENFLKQEIRLVE